MQPRFLFSVRPQQPSQAGWLLLALLLCSGLSAFAQTTSFTGIANNTIYATGTSPVTATDVSSTGWDFTSLADDIGSNARVLANSGTGTNAGALGPNDPFIRTSRNTTTNNATEGRVRRTTGTAFKLNSIYLEYGVTGGRVGQSITLVGYLNGSPVTGATLTQPQTTAFSFIQFVTSGIAAFNNVDELRVTAATTGAGYLTVIGFDEINITVAAAPMPVELLAFTAQRQGETAALTWATASEQNSAYFEVQASPDGATFRAIGKVAAAGSSLLRHDYAFTDANLPGYNAPQVYYRLRQVDQDGTAAYSPVRVVAADGAGSLAVYPNPTHGYLLVLRPAGAGTEAQLRNALGQVVRVLALPTAETRVDLSGLAPGVYALTLPGAGLVQRVVID